MAKTPSKQKIVIYHVFTRLFGNKNTSNIPWGTIDQNGVGKFADFTELALKEIKNLGVTHIWFTGVLHHALVNDYSAMGISNDNANVVKGRAGSPYAVKDYYNVNPDLAMDPKNRLQEFIDLIKRTHKAGMKVLIDIVPNHVARNYEGLTNPKGVKDFGADDDKSVEYGKDNNFYYVPGQAFQLPDWLDGYVPLGGTESIENHYEEFPAKWTGNGSRLPKPHFHDWYETVKINFGIAPDGSLDFDLLPEEAKGNLDFDQVSFWKDKELPDSWVKFKEIAEYWLSLGVDGFRFDMAELVPVEFWGYLNSFIKEKNPDAITIAEVYDPSKYRSYIYEGRMDYLYDKVDLYDGLKHIMKGYGWTDHINTVQHGLMDIEHHMLHFLENHDEQRIASPEFAGNALLGKPAMVVSATIGTSPTMIYFGQEVGEDGSENAGFGSASRTSIFDYIGVPAHQRWMNGGHFDGGGSSKMERELRDFYKRLLNFTISSRTLMGAYQELHFYNKENTENYDHRVFSFARWKGKERLIVVSNFEEFGDLDLDFKVPSSLIQEWKLDDGEYQLQDCLNKEAQSYTLRVNGGIGHIPLLLNALESVILKIQ